MSETWIDDVDLGDAGWVIGADPGHLGGLALSDASSPVLGAIGPIWLAEPTQATARRLAISGHVKADSNAQLHATLDRLKALAYAGAKRIRFADRPTQEFRDGRCIDFVARPRMAVLTNLACDLTMTFEFDDPLRYDVQPQGIPLSTARAALPTGTMPSTALLTWIHGNGASLSAITLTLRNAAGDPAQTMGLTGTLGSTEYLLIDHGRTQITKYTAGVAADALSWWTSGDFLSLRAADGNYELAQYPTLELGGTGTPAGLCTYARAYA